MWTTLGQRNKPRKYGVATVLAHQWLQQTANEGDNMLAAIRNATNVKVVFRIKDPVEAEDLAHTVVPLDLEIPVRALIRPTVVGHRRIRLASEGESEQSANTESFAETIGESESRSESYATMRATMHADSSASASLESFSTSEAQSQMQANGVGLNATSTQMLTPAIGMFDTPVIVGVSDAMGSSSITSEGFGSSTGTMRSAGASYTKGTSVGTTTATTWGESISRGTHRALSSGVARTVGSGKTRGNAEALEPILEDRPSSVHGKDAVLYMAAQTLRNLPTGTAFINYVGARGMVATLLVVPPVRDYQLLNEAFVILREHFLSKSSAAIPATIAQAEVEARERAFLTFTAPVDETPEPESFRVAARASAPGRAPSGPVATEHEVLVVDKEHVRQTDKTSLTDGGKKEAMTSSCQGSRPPEAAAQSTALDRKKPRPKRPSMRSMA